MPPGTLRFPDSQQPCAPSLSTALLAPSKRASARCVLCGQLLVPSPCPFATQIRAKAAEGLWLAPSQLLPFWSHRLPGPAELNSPLCSELPSPAAFSRLNNSSWSSAKDGTKANHLVIVVLKNTRLRAAVHFAFWFYLFVI